MMNDSHRSRRSRLRLLSFAAAGVVALGGFAIQGQTQANFYRRQAQVTYLRSLEELSSQMNALSANLNKTIYVGTPAQMQQLASQIWRQAGSAKSALTSLPLGQIQLDNTYRFLSQTGSYAMALARELEGGETFTQEDRQTLSSLLESCRELSAQIDRLEGQVSSGEKTLDEIAGEYWEAETAPGADNGAQPTAASTQSDGAGGENSFKEMESSLDGMPKLIYDGPFSDHLLEAEPQWLLSLPEVTQEEAHRIAATAAGVDRSEIAYTQDENSAMPSYCFNGEEMEVGITKNGGLVTYLLNSRPVGAARLSVDQAKTQAENHLDRLGLEGMEPTYYETRNNICTINFAYHQGEVRCYTDLIKVGVALDDGQVVSIDARGYLSSHKERQISIPELSVQEAMASVSETLTVESSRLSIIPSPGENDLLTYEFLCTAQDGQQVLVYINAMTGAEEQILILQISDTGVLTL